MKKKRFGFWLAVLCMGVFAGCGSTSESAASADYDYSYAAYDDGSGETDGIAQTYGAEAAESTVETDTSGEPDAGTVSAGSADVSGDVVLTEEKLVYHCNLEIETTEYAKSLQNIRSMIETYQGIVQSENETDNSDGWYYEDYCKTSGTLSNYLQVRIPSADYPDFLEGLDGVGKIVSKSTNVENISEEYYDTTVQIEAYETQEQNLLAMLEQCDNITDMITVQDRLTEVSYELNRLKTSLRSMDTDVAYSYVNIWLTEVMEYSEDENLSGSTFFGRLQETFVNTWQGFLEFLEFALFGVIYLLPYAALAAVVYLVVRRLRRARKAGKQLKLDETGQEDKK